MNKFSTQVILIGSIFILPIILNLGYKYFVNSTPIANTNFVDNHPHFFSLKYHYPNIPENSLVKIEDSNLYKYLPEKYLNKNFIPYKDMNLELIPNELKSKLNSEYYYLGINFTIKGCSLISQVQNDELNAQLQLNESEIIADKSVEFYTYFGYNFFKIRTGPDLDELRAYIKSNCILPINHGYTLFYSDKSKYYE